MAKIIELPCYRMDYTSIEEMTSDELNRRLEMIKDFTPGERWHLLLSWKFHKNKLNKML
jgi:uncharacterized SAM-dependent methyltransferase